MGQEAHHRSAEESRCRCVNEKLNELEKLLSQLTEKLETVSLLKFTLICLLY